MKNERQLLLYIITILFILLLVSGFGYMNYKNKTFVGLDRTITYSANKHLKYASLNWIVVKDTGKYVTLILAENAKLGTYGDSINFIGSDALKYMNKVWINSPAQKDLLVEMEHGALVYDSSSRSYLRLIRYEELVSNPIKNDSNTPYWTMSYMNDKIIYALANGHTEYTTYREEESTKGDKCYFGNHSDTLDGITKRNVFMALEQTKTLAEPYDMHVISSVSTEQEVSPCYKEYTVDSEVQYSATGESTSYISKIILRTKEEAIGIRPVITVKKR